MGGGFSTAIDCPCNPDGTLKKSNESFATRIAKFNDGAAGIQKAVGHVTGIANDAISGVRRTGKNVTNTATSLVGNYNDLRQLGKKNTTSATSADGYPDPEVYPKPTEPTESNDMVPYGGDGEGFFEGGAASFEKKPLDSILAYRKSKSHESKKALAEKIIEALKIAGVNVREGGDIADIARAIMEKLPNPHKDQSYKIESESQKNVLKSLVKGLNDAFTPGASEEHKLIRPTTELDEIARQAIELVYSMTTGVHEEFLTVQASVVNALHNVKVLRQLMDTAHDEVVSQANNLIANPERDNANYETYQEIYKRIAKECDRQIEMLSNMLDATMGPETNVLQQLADETSADYKYIKKYVIGNTMDLKTSAFVMAHLVHGVAATAVMLTVADKVFEKLGEQMKHLKGATEEVVDKAFDELILKNPSEAAKYIKWKTTIKMYNAEQKVREETMKKHNLNSDRNTRHAGIAGAAELFQERRNKYDVALNKKTKERQIIFSDFIVKTAKEYAKLLAAIDVFGPKLGSEVPISDKLLDLREAFSRLIGPEMGFGQGKLERALIGFDPEIDGRQLRDAFMNNIRLVKTVVEHVMSMELYSSSRQYFEPVLAVVTKIIEQIDFYYDVIKQKYGNSESGASGGDDDDISLEDYELPEVSRASHDLRKSVNSFIYYYYVAKVKENLKQTHSEVASYGEEYESLLGEAVACKLKKLKQAYDDTNEKIELALGPDNYLKKVADATEPKVDAANAPDVINYAYKVNIKAAYKMCNDLNKKEFECKQNFYKALQAVDLYLKEFTEGATAHPEDIADIKKMLTGVDLIGPWYDEKTGNHLAHAFDMCENTGNLIDQTPGVPLHIWSDTISTMGNAIIGTDITGQLAREGVTIDSHPKNMLSNSNDLHSREERLAGNVAGRAAAILLDPTRDTTNTANKSKHYYENLISSTYKLGSPGDLNFKENFDLLLSSQRELATYARNHFNSTYDNFQALKNIINAVVRMGDKFGNKELRNSVFMSPSEIFKALMAYIKGSAMSLNISHVITKQVLELTITANNGNATNANERNKGFKTSQMGVRNPKIFLFIGKVGENSNFVDEDMHFQMIVKAMATKILTVIGMYELFNRPGPIYDLTPTRMIIGGGSIGHTEINPDATELYFRLVRLAEYYRSDILKFDTAIQDDQISLIPDISGVFTGFIRLMWLKFGQTTVDTGTYSESELKMIIAECNSIYQHFKGESGTNSISYKACNEFVMEINRRYGAVKRDDFEKFYKMMRLSGEINANRDEYNNYAILPNEGELRAKRPAPSDQYVILGKDATNLTLKCKTELASYNKKTYIEKLQKFRNNLNDSFVDARGDNNFVNISYSERIKQAAIKIRTGTESEKYEIVSQLIRGSNALASTDIARDYFFHETVVTGINTLTAITKMLQHIRNVVNLMHKSAENTPASTGLGADVAVGTDGSYVGNIRPIPDTQNNNTNPPTLNTKLMLYSIISLVNGLNNAFDEKIKIRFPQSNNSQLLVDFSDLSNSLEDLMESVQYFINLMRQYMPQNVVNKYEGADSSSEGTIKWLEKHLFAELLKGRINRYNTQSLNMDPESDNNTLESVTKKIDNLYSRIILNYNNNNKALQILVYGNTTLVGTVPTALENDQGLNYLMGDMAPQRPIQGQNPKPNRTKFNIRYKIWDGTTIDLTKRGMLPVFNQLLAMYLTQFYDISVKKIYRGLIENFASGSFNQAISMPVSNTYNDLGYIAALLPVVGGRRQGVLTDPYIDQIDANTPINILQPPQNVLCRSLALILQRMMSDTTREGVSAHLISTLSEVPMYIRERMRVNLLVFNKMFTLLQKKGEFTKQLLEKTDIILGRNTRDADVNNRTNMIAFIDKIVEGCYTLATSASDVYRELADEPKYLQTQENSIRDYQARYGKIPLMPLSSALHYLKYTDNSTTATPEQTILGYLFPTNSVGSANFKMMYGVRGMFNDRSWKLSSASAPGIMDALEKFKQNSNIKVDESKYEQLVNGVVGTLRGIIDARYYEAGMSDYTNNVSAARLISYAYNSVFKTATVIGDDQYKVYSLTTTFQKVLSTTEGSSQSIQMTDIINMVNRNVPGGNMVNDTNQRKKERIYNIIDMNIIPINVHALMRTIPLAPLYNYTFTFEENARLTLGIKNSNVFNPTTAREFFYKILEDPYYHYTKTNPNAAINLNSQSSLLKTLSNMMLDINARGNTPNHIHTVLVECVTSFKNILNASEIDIILVNPSSNILNIALNCIDIIRTLLFYKYNTHPDKYIQYAYKKFSEYDSTINANDLNTVKEYSNAALTLIYLTIKNTDNSFIDFVNSAINFMNNKNILNILDTDSVLDNLDEVLMFNLINDNFDNYIDDPYIRNDVHQNNNGHVAIIQAYLNLFGIIAIMFRYLDSIFDPIKSLDRYEFQGDNTLAALMHGDESLLMGRPKFISDQLFHKVLPTVNNNNQLTYYENGKMNYVDVLNTKIQNLKEVFKCRFNTRIVRNLMHCTNVQRVLRLKLNQELTHYRDELVDNTAITNAGVTEFGNLSRTDMRQGPTTGYRRMDPRFEDSTSRTYNRDKVIQVAR